MSLTERRQSKALRDRHGDGFLLATPVAKERKKTKNESSCGELIDDLGWEGRVTDVTLSQFSFTKSLLLKMSSFKDFKTQVFLSCSLDG